MGKIRWPDSLFTEVIGILKGIFIIIEMTAERGRFSYTGIREGQRRGTGTQAFRESIYRKTGGGDRAHFERRSIWDRNEKMQKILIPRGETLCTAELP